MGRRGDAADLALSVASIYACYLAYGFFQERLFAARYGAEGRKRFRFPAFLVLVQCVVNGLVGAALCAARPQPRMRTPLPEFARVSLSHVGASLSSNAALGFVSYPTQALAKSCKIIPVMLVGVAVNGRRYRAREYAHMALVSAGVALFMLARPAGVPPRQVAGDEDEQPAVGLGLLLVSLVLDGFTSPNQERLRRLHGPSAHQLMMYMNGISATALGAVMLGAGALRPAIAFVTAHPAAVRDVGLLALASGAGQVALLATLYRFSALVLTTITTTRKLATILFSVVCFGHHLTAGSWAGVAMVFAGLGLDARWKRAERLKTA